MILFCCKQFPVVKETLAFFIVFQEIVEFAMNAYR